MNSTGPAFYRWKAELNPVGFARGSHYENYQSNLPLSGSGNHRIGRLELVRASLDPNDLVVVSWPVPTDAKAGTDTATKIQITNHSYGEARVVGINHC